MLERQWVTKPNICSSSKSLDDVQVRSYVALDAREYQHDLWAYV